jgi:hypothetical protein
VLAYLCATWPMPSNIALGGRPFSASMSSTAAMSSPPTGLSGWMARRWALLGRLGKMSEKEPILFRSMLGSLRPVSAAAEELTKATSGEVVRVEVKRTTGNTRRLALYWVALRITVEQLSDAVDGILSTKAMHRKLKRDLELAKPIVSKKTGEVVDYDYDSISFEKMPENERAEFITAALEKMSRWIGCDVTTLTREAEREAA